MVLDQFYSGDENGLCFTRQQASGFAKQIADDFNPLHDPDAKLFCVPGDLLFAVTLARHGLSQRMCFTFSGMVGDGIQLRYRAETGDDLSLVDGAGKAYLGIERDGDVTRAPSLIDEFTRRYVEFSGKNFLQVLVPAMNDKGVMINPDRPIVIYQSMSIDLKTLDIAEPSLQLMETRVQVEGKKGDVRMLFCLKSGNHVVGEGEKRMALRGLRPFDEDAMQRLVKTYKGYKTAHSA
ncbi:MAG: DUF3581 domain-containing protein [Sedimenticola sp.]|nr:DUF3581 domain-containing protein [Sedimenticola sp.]